MENEEIKKDLKVVEKDIITLNCYIKEKKFKDITYYQIHCKLNDYVDIILRCSDSTSKELLDKYILLDPNCSEDLKKSLN